MKVKIEMQNKFSKNVYDTMERLVSMPSISGTEQESIAANKIYGSLVQVPYFKENSYNVGIENIKDDPLNRSFVWAVVNGKEYSDDTFILSGHLDVVGVEEFGYLRSAAFDIKKCTERISEMKLDESTESDIKSGNWIFGRGTADMKFGLALNMELIKEFSINRNFKGNLMILIVPGEESNSEGMLSAVPFLLKLSRSRKYRYCGMIISEPSVPEKGETDSKRLYIGSVGKIMPLFFCVGKETHVGESLNGLNPNLLVSEINRLLECNGSFSDNVSGTVTPPPMCLKQTDLKKLYSVQSPLYAASYYNVMTLKAGYEKLIEDLKNLANTAFLNVMENIFDKRNRFMKKYNQKLNFESFKPCVVTYSDILEQVKEKYKNFNSYIDQKIDIWKKERRDNQSIAVNIVRETYELYGEKKPMIIISFIPPYYPHRYMKSRDNLGRRFMNVVDKSIEYAKNELHEDIVKTDFFMGISDASYTGIDEGESSVDDLVSNIVGYDTIYKFPADELKRIDIPVIIFGGEGKDLHKYTERLNLPYSFNVVPKIYKYIILNMLC